MDDNKKAEVKLSSSKVAQIAKGYEKRQRVLDDFIDSSGYMDVVKSWIEGMGEDEMYEVDDSYPEQWGEAEDMTFSILSDTAHEIHHFKENAIVEYNGVLIRLFEMHGQGCYRLVSLSLEEAENYIPLQDIIEHLLIGDKPPRYKVLEVVRKGLSAITAINGDTIEVDGENVYVGEVWGYLIENLK